MLMAKADNINWSPENTLNEPISEHIGDYSTALDEKN